MYVQSNNLVDIAKNGRYRNAVKGLIEYAKYKRGKANFTDNARVDLAKKVCDTLELDDIPENLKELWKEAQSKI